MIKLLYAGFDTLDVAFAGALPDEVLETLRQARADAHKSQAPTLTTIGPGKVDMHVSGHGMRGGYAFLTDTGPLGAKWMFKDNADTRQWNIFASPRATALLAHGYEGTRTLLLDQLQAMGARLTDHSINRVDFAMDFQTQGFELHQEQFVAHSHTKMSPHWGKQDTATDRNQPAAVLRGRRLESVTIGKQPGRQIIVYDKRREAIERQKPFWFEAWGIDGNDPALEVWRVEVRAGKKELKDKYQIRNFADFAAGIGDVVFNAVREVRYLDDWQLDSNVTRQRLHPLWREVQSTAAQDLLAYRSGLTPGQVVEVERVQILERYANLCIGNSVGLAVALGRSDQALHENLASIVAEQIRKRANWQPEQIARKVRRVKNRHAFALKHFLSD